MENGRQGTEGKVRQKWIRYERKRGRWVREEKERKVGMGDIG